MTYFRKYPEEIPAIGEPVLLVVRGVIQHITYVRDETDGGDFDAAVTWFEPYFFKHGDDLKIPIQEVSHWAYVDELDTLV